MQFIKISSISLSKYRWGEGGGGFKMEKIVVPMLELPQTLLCSPSASLKTVSAPPHPLFFVRVKFHCPPPPPRPFCSHPLPIIDDWFLMSRNSKDSSTLTCGHTFCIQNTKQAGIATDSIDNAEKSDPIQGGHVVRSQIDHVKDLSQGGGPWETNKGSLKLVQNTWKKKANF